MIIQNLTFRYAKKDIFRDYSAELPDACVLTGSNGAGKTTLLKLMAGILTPDSGSISIPGIESRRASIYLDDQILFDEISIRAHLAWTAAYTRQSPSAADEIISKFELAPLLDACPCELSAGQRQRCALALVLSVPADICLLDEPLRCLDSSYRQKLVDYLMQMPQNKKRIVIADQESSCQVWKDIFPCIALPGGCET